MLLPLSMRFFKDSNSTLSTSNLKHSFFITGDFLKFKFLEKSNFMGIVYFQIKSRIFSASDRIVFANDRIFLVKVVYFQPGSYTFQLDRIL